MQLGEVLEGAWHPKACNTYARRQSFTPQYNQAHTVVGAAAHVHHHRKERVGGIAAG